MSPSDDPATAALTVSGAKQINACDQCGAPVDNSPFYDPATGAGPLCGVGRAERLRQGVSSPYYE